MPSGLPRDLRVLFVTYTVPWRPRYGGALRCHGVIKELAKRCDLHVAFAGNDPAAVEAFLAWSDESDVTRHTLTPDPGWQSVADGRASITTKAILDKGKYYGALQQLAQDIQPQVIWHFEVQSLRRTGLLHPRLTVLDYCDVRWWKQRRLAQQASGGARIQGLLKAAVLHLDDVQLALRVRHSVVASPAEVRLLRPARNVSALPNGFDFPATLPPVSRESKRLLFYGSLFYKPNEDGVRWLCREVWPLIRAQDPEAQLDVVGLGKEALSDIIGMPGVTFHGFVDDLDAMIAQAAALVVPLRVAGGTRIKILEAWAKGLPVVSTTIGAEGLAAQDGITALLGDTPEAFAARCLTVLGDAEMRQRLAVSGYEHGRRTYDWSVIGLSIEELLGKLSE